MSLRSELYGLLGRARRLCRGCPEAEGLKRCLDELKGRLDAPLCVAVAGSMKSGKSTLLNALLGADILCTGSLETTCVPIWLRYGETPSLSVHFPDGREESVPFGELEKWTAHGGHGAKDAGAGYAVLHYPAELLKQMEFIDTPGLNSIYASDTRGAMGILAWDGEAAAWPGNSQLPQSPGGNEGSSKRESAPAEGGLEGADPGTRRRVSEGAPRHAEGGLEGADPGTGEPEAERLRGKLHGALYADAVLYAFDRTVTEHDREALRAFRADGGAMAPIHVAGILTKADVSGAWDVFSSESPVEAAMEAARGMMGREEVKGVAFCVTPVCAKAAEGFLRLTEEDFALLRILAAQEPEAVEEALCDASGFASGALGAGIPKTSGMEEARRHTIGLLGQYGVRETAALLKKGKEREKIYQELLGKCGILAVRELLRGHFGNHAALIKARQALGRLGEELKNVRKDPASSPRLRGICGQIAEEIGELTSSQQAWREQKALQAYYGGQLSLEPEEEEDLLRITGEYGRAAETRLGMEEGATVESLRRSAREKAEFWHSREWEAMRPGAYVEAASVLARSYERMLYHLDALCEE